MTDRTHPLETAIASSRRLRPETKRLYLSAAGLWIQFAGADMQRWSGRLVEAWRDEMEARSLGADTINVRLYALRFAGQRLRELGTGPDFASGAETLPPAPTRNRRPLTLAQATQLLAALRPAKRAPMPPPALRDRAIILTMLHTGVRVGGLVRLGLGDLTAASMAVTLKGGKLHRTPPLHREVLDAVDAWRAFLSGRGVTRGRLFRGMQADLGSAPLEWRILDQMSEDAVRKMITRRAQQAGLRAITPHIFRHTFVSWLRAAGVPDWQIALYTGHAVVPATGQVPTLGTYTGDVSGQPLPMPAIEEA